VWHHCHKHDQRECESFQLGKPQQTGCLLVTIGIGVRVVFDISGKFVNVFVDYKRFYKFTDNLQP